MTHQSSNSSPSSTPLEIPMNEQNLLKGLVKPLCDTGSISPATFKALKEFLKVGPIESGHEAKTERLISRKEAARMLSVSPRTLDRLPIPKLRLSDGGVAQFNSGRQHRVGGTVRLKLSDVQAYIESCQDREV